MRLLIVLPALAAIGGAVLFFLGITRPVARGGFDASKIVAGVVLMAGGWLLGQMIASALL